MSARAMKLYEADHPYYAAEGNYYSGGDRNYHTYDSWDAFLSEWDDADLDMNLIYRWDWDVPDPEDYVGEELPEETLNLYYMGQRKALAWSVHVEVSRDQEPEIRDWLKVRAQRMREIWEPLL